MKNLLSEFDKYFLSSLIFFGFIIFQSHYAYSQSSDRENLEESLLVTHSLNVRRYTSVSLSNGTADSILNDASSVLQTYDGSGDVACDVTMTRNGGVSVFSSGDGSVDSSTDFYSLGTGINVVTAINWCGGFAPNIIGCATVPGTTLAVVRFSSNQEGILWAHEFGHNQGLGHRSSSTAVMNGTINTNRRRVNSTECNAYLN
jgi:Matrixin